ncbi:MAG: serine/threonine-protein phosphatase [Oscillospiraceae bacterium]|nr:serine/threonine-protein phosphatase [Oscillospiraceae bacterium]
MGRQIFDTTQTSMNGARNILRSAAGRQIIVFVLALIFSGTKIMTSFSPFGAALIAAMPWEYSYIAFSGAAIGYILFGSLTGNIYYIFTLCALILLKLVLRKNTKLAENPIFNSLAAAVISLGAAAGLAIAGGGDFGYFFARRVLESVLCASSSFFFCTAYNTLYPSNTSKQYEPNILQSSSIVVACCVLLTSLCSIGVFSMNAGRSLAALAVLVFARRKGASGAAVCSIAAGISLVLHDPEFTVNAGLLITAGFLAGVFRPLGKPGQIAIFVFVNIFGALIIGKDPLLGGGIFDVFAATVIFMFLPERIYSFIGAAQTAGVRASAQPQNSLSSKLDFSSRTLADIQDSVQKVSAKLKGLSANDIFTVYTKTADTVCKRCGLNTFCWVTAYNDTMRAMNAMTETLRKEGGIAVENAPASIKQKCCRLDSFIEDINYNYRDFLSCETAARRVDEAREVALEQFDAVVNMLTEMSRELSEVASFDDTAAKKTRDILNTFGVLSGEICCLIGKYGRMIIEIYTDDISETDLKILTSELSGCLERQFDIPSIMTAKEKTKLSFFEQAMYTMEFSSHQISEKENEVCGDTCEYFVDGKGFAHMIVSDGMGAGKRAAIDSVMVCALILKLIKAGFGFDSAIRFINSSFLIKSQDESLATIDVGCIDLYTGTLELLKAGAATSFVLKGKSVIEIKNGSFPVGIIQGATFGKNKLKLTGGDLVVMVSDGVTASGEDWIAAEIEQYRQEPAKEIARRICGEAKRRRLDGHSDDITVIAARLVKV